MVEPAKVPEVDSGGYPVWEIKNECLKHNDRKVKLEKVRKGMVLENPLDRQCKVESKPGKAEMAWIICKVTKVLNPHDPPVEYDIGGDFDVDPKLVVRPPGTLCPLCRIMCVECFAKP